jgi:hypothetical protein
MMPPGLRKTGVGGRPWPDELFELAQTASRTGARDGVFGARQFSGYSREVLVAETLVPRSMTSSSPRPLLVLHAGQVLTLFAAGCGGLGPVARPPWVEDQSLQLLREELIVDVGPSTASVEARLELRGSTEARELGFPIGGEPRAVAFQALVAERGEPKLVLPARRGEAGLLPVGPATENWDIVVPEHALGRRGTELVVSYRQPAVQSFRYVLRSGAYWAGPIVAFVARVNDPHRRVAHALLDGLAPEQQAHGGLSWTLSDYEPKDALTLALK